MRLLRQAWPIDMSVNERSDTLHGHSLQHAGSTVPVSVGSLEQAAHWYATLRDDDVTENDRMAWTEWLQASPENTQAWEHIDAVSRRFDPLRSQQTGGTAAVIAGVDAARSLTYRRRNLVNGLASVLGLGVAGLLGWRYTPVPRYVAAIRSDHHTTTGELRAIELDDGSRVWMNTTTALQVRYQDTLRQLVLLDGEILVDTAQDARGRPFYVHTSVGRMQALGTRFSVQFIDKQVRLDVFEGVVEIQTTAGVIRRVDAGQASAFDNITVTALGSASPAREAWHRRRLPADDMALGDLLTELGRYRFGHITVSPEAAQLKVMGVYPTDDTDRALAMLEQNLPIQVRQPLPWWTYITVR